MLEQKECKELTFWTQFVSNVIGLTIFWGGSNKSKNRDRPNSQSRWHKYYCGKKYILHRYFKARYSSFLSWTTAFLSNLLTDSDFKIWHKWNKSSFHSNAIKLKRLFLSSPYVRDWEMDEARHHHHQEPDQHYCHVNGARQHPASLQKDYNKHYGQSFTERFECFLY